MINLIEMPVCLIYAPNKDMTSQSLFRHWSITGVQCFKFFQKKTHLFTHLAPFWMHINYQNLSLNFLFRLC